MILGVDPDGRSTVLEMRDVARALIPGPDAGSAVTRLWRTGDEPPPGPAPRPPAEEWFDTGLSPSAAQWALFSLDPETFRGSFHHSSSIDFVTVLGGEVTLALETGDVILSAGDSALNPGVSHKWVAGQRGSVVSVFMCAYEKPDGGSPALNAVHL